MTERTFAFDIDDTVTVPFGYEGIVRMQAADRGGIRYNVDFKTEKGIQNDWFYENELIAR